VGRALLGGLDEDAWSDDFQLALYCCYELHYGSFRGVCDTWEWDPALLACRAELEQVFEAALRARCSTCGAEVVPELERLADAPGPSLSRYMAERGTMGQFAEFVVHRSAYQLKEADPHTWVIPRLTGAPKAAVIHVQMEEYGDGVEEAVHSTLFAGVMEEFGLDLTPSRYLDIIPGSTLATTNLISLFGLHRRLRGALVGHLALFEMTSVTPMSRYSAALSRLGAGARARRFYDVHVEADEDHSQVAAHRIAGRLAEELPMLADDIVFGARAAKEVEDRFASALLSSWADGRSSLLGPIAC
jgi:hypothetical protein